MKNTIRVFKDGVLVQEETTEYTEKEYFRLLKLELAQNNENTLKEITDSLISLNLN